MLELEPARHEPMRGNSSSSSCRRSTSRKWPFGTNAAPSGSARDTFRSTSPSKLGVACRIAAPPRLPSYRGPLGVNRSSTRRCSPGRTPAVRCRHGARRRRLTRPRSQLRGLLDRQAIVDCVHRYARGVDRGDEELLRSAYHDDAVERHGPYAGGLDGLVEFLGAAHRPFPGYQRYVTNTSVELDGDDAHAESYYLCVLRRDDGRLLLSGGRYVDRLERRGGGWRIARRVVVGSRATCSAAVRPRRRVPAAARGRSAASGVAVQRRNSSTTRSNSSCARASPVPAVGEHVHLRLRMTHRDSTLSSG